MAKKEVEVKKTGRPTKYKEEYCDMLIEHMSKGFSFETFAAVIDVNQDTLHEWAKVNPIFSEAKKTAFLKCRYFWENIGIEGLWNEPLGRTLNTGVWVFNMKNRFKWSDRVEVSGDDEKPIVLGYDPRKLME